VINMKAPEATLPNTFAKLSLAGFNSIQGQSQQLRPQPQAEHSTTWQ
jgi:hypothetical protein